MANLFGKDFIKQVEKHIAEKVIERMDKITIHAHNRLTTETAVDYGQARAGWNIALNEPDQSVPIRKKGQKTKASKIKKKARKIGDSYFITNNVNHIVYLNEGTSSQSATNFIEIELTQAVKDIG